MPAIISNDDADHAYEIVKRICTRVGPGLPGSSQERERARIIKQELELHLGAGNVAIEEFTFAPGAFLGAQRLSAIFMVISALLNYSTGRTSGASPWLTAGAALVFAILSPPFSWPQMAATVVSALAFYRGLCFTHEITHLRRRSVPGFETVWNLVLGVPLLLPSFTYVGVHQSHHSLSTYGTRDDPDAFR